MGTQENEILKLQIEKKMKDLLNLIERIDARVIDEKNAKIPIDDYNGLISLKNELQKLIFVLEGATEYVRTDT